jgi:SAM domain (Sterile alpha motif)
VATITEWLASLGLPEYAQRFAENGIDVLVLRYLTDQDLEKIGVLLERAAGLEPPSICLLAGRYATHAAGRKTAPALPDKAGHLIVNQALAYWRVPSLPALRLQMF